MEGLRLLRDFVVGLPFALFLLCGCSSQSDASAEVQTPLVLLTAGIHEAGIVPFGSSVEHRFRLLNTTDEELHIDVIKTSCGCAEAKVSPERIPPGAEAEVLVVLEMDSLFGKDVRVILASSRFPYVLASLQVRARAAGADRLLVKPRDMRLEGTSGVFTGTFQVRCIHREKGEPELAIEGPEWIRTEVLSSETSSLGGGLMERRFEVSVRVDHRDKSPGDYESNVVFSTSFESVGVERARIHVSVKGVYRAEPESIFLGVGIDEDVTRRVRMHALWPGFEIKSVVCEDERVQLSWTDDADGVEIQLTFDPFVSGTRSGGELVETNVVVSFEPAASPLVVGVTGWLARH